MKSVYKAIPISYFKLNKNLHTKSKWLIVNTSITKSMNSSYQLRDLKKKTIEKQTSAKIKLNNKAAYCRNGHAYTHKKSKICIQVIQSVLSVSAPRNNRKNRLREQQTHTTMNQLICRCRQCNIKILLRTFWIVCHIL